MAIWRCPACGRLARYSRVALVCGCTYLICGGTLMHWAGEDPEELVDCGLFRLRITRGLW